MFLIVFIYSINSLFFYVFVFDYYCAIWLWHNLSLHSRWHCPRKDNYVPCEFIGGIIDPKLGLNQRPSAPKAPNTTKAPPRLIILDTTATSMNDGKWDRTHYKLTLFSDCACHRLLVYPNFPCWVMSYSHRVSALAIAEMYAKFLYRVYNSVKNS